MEETLEALNIPLIRTITEMLTGYYLDSYFYFLLGGICFSNDILKFTNINLVNPDPLATDVELPVLLVAFSSSSYNNCHQFWFSVISTIFFFFSISPCSFLKS